MPVLALGVSYRRASVDLLERLSFGEDDLSKAYRHLAGLDAVEEAVVLSTCNRVEVYAEVDGYHHGFQELKRFLSESRDVPPDEFVEPLYSHYEDDAAEHAFSVAAGLDSMILGEPQILSQLRQAFLRATEEGVCGARLGSLFRRAIRAGRRVRAETDIGASPAAFVEAGARMAAEHLGGLEGRSLLVVGAGKMSGLAIRSLRDMGVADVRIVNRTPGRAEGLAARTGATHGSLDRLSADLARADLVVSSTGSTGHVIGVTAVEEAMRRRERPLFLLDLAVPRDVDPAVRGVPGVRVADIDDLGHGLPDRPAGAAEEAARALALVEEEARRYSADRRAARLAPVIAALHERGEHVRARELQRVAGRLGELTDRERQAVDAVTRGIVKTLLHQPVVRLKGLSADGRDQPYARALVELFGLDRDLLEG